MRLATVAQSADQQTTVLLGPEISQYSRERQSFDSLHTAIEYARSQPEGNFLISDREFDY